MNKGRNTKNLLAATSDILHKRFKWAICLVAVKSLNILSSHTTHLNIEYKFMINYMTRIQFA